MVFGGGIVSGDLSQFLAAAGIVDSTLPKDVLSSKQFATIVDVLSEGDVIKVKLIGFDRGKMKLSKKVLESDT